MNRICYVVGAGDCADISIDRHTGDLVIAADGGYAACRALGLTPELAVGDFDSLDYVPEGIDVRRHPPEKDDTDMFLAVREGQRRGYDRFLLYGGLGGRLDHSLANIQALAAVARQGDRAWLWGQGTALTVLRNGSLTFPGKYSGVFSVFAHGGTARGVCLRGCKYPLENAELDPDYPLGVSNEFLGRPVELSVADGALTILWYSAAPETEALIREEGRP